ncbi:HNH endonuclease signature motif containing protein [Salarchaeum sp. III]|uniref:HNH endonuclease n=1 Tax=Salarchaeum sp. III TaxID=3107927 RepID=UPI002ED7C706
MECPACGKQLPTEQGVRQHHTKVHGDPLPNRTCADCNRDFYDPKSRRTYCDDCYSEAGEKNGNYQNAKETAACERCGDTFDYYPSEKKGVYCSDCVENADGLLPENPAERERVVTECPACGSGNTVVPSRAANSRGVFCDSSCYGAWLSEHVVGETHHQWAGGPIQYGRTWWRVRRRALRRDQYRCQRCLRSEGQLPRRPDVHHIRPVREFENPSDAHRLDNVVALCRPCHRRVEEGLVELPRDQ